MRRAFAVLGALLLAGCVATPDLSAGPDGRLGTLAGSEWRLETLRGTPVASEAWLGFESDSRAGGNAGCNSFGGNYAYLGPAIEFTDVAVTLMGCPGAAMQVEEAFLAALRDARRAGTSATRLVLIGDDGTALASFSPR